MTTAAYIPARASSVRLPGKNVRPLAGVPLVRRTVDVALDAQHAGLVDRVVLDTDDEQIAAVGAGAEIRMRPETLRGTDVRVVDLLRAWLAATPDVDLVCVLMATSPLRTLKHLTESRAALRDDVDGVLSLTQFTQDIGHAVFVPARDRTVQMHYPTAGARAVLRDAGKHDGTAAWYRRAALLTLPPHENVYALRLAPYWVPTLESVDVDTERDFLIADALLRRRG